MKILLLFKISDTVIKYCKVTKLQFFSSSSEKNLFFKKITLMMFPPPPKTKNFEPPWKNLIGATPIFHHLKTSLFPFSEKDHLMDYLKCIISYSTLRNDSSNNFEQIVCLVRLTVPKATWDWSRDALRCIYWNFLKIEHYC